MHYSVRPPHCPFVALRSLNGQANDIPTSLLHILPCCLPHILTQCLWKFSFPFFPFYLGSGLHMCKFCPLCHTKAFSIKLSNQSPMLFWAYCSFSLHFLFSEPRFLLFLLLQPVLEHPSTLIHMKAAQIKTLSLML